MESKFLRQFSEGEKFSGVAVVQKIYPKEKKDGHSYLNLFISDAGGRVPAKIWKNAEKLKNELRPNMICKISGIFHTYHDRNELHIDAIRLARKNERKISRLIPCGVQEPEPMIENITAHISSISNQFLVDLLRKIFPNKKSLQQFLAAPSGKLWHHNYLYGTLQSISFMLDMVNILVQYYPASSADMLKAGIIIRAFGRQSGINIENYIEYSTERRLLGRAIMSGMEIEKCIRSLKSFPEQLRMEILHLLAFDEDAVENGMPPKTAEAIILSGLEKLNMQTNAVWRIIENDQIPGSEWTRFNNLLNRFVYVGDKAHHNESNEKDE